MVMRASPSPARHLRLAKVSAGLMATVVLPIPPWPGGSQEMFNVLNAFGRGLWRWSTLCYLSHYGHSILARDKTQPRMGICKDII